MEAELRLLVKLLESVCRVYDTNMDIEMLTSDDKESRMKNISKNHQVGVEPDVETVEVLTQEPDEQWKDRDDQEENWGQEGDWDPEEEEEDWKQQEEWKQHGKDDRRNVDKSWKEQLSIEDVAIRGEKL